MHNEDNNVINIQLPYNPHAPTEPELWDGSFHPISLHGSIEHLASDAKNIKDSLNFMAKYISNKQINSSKANEVREFNSIGKTIWNLISSVYNANWDSLNANKQSNLLRRKISIKFTLKIQPAIGKNNKEVNNPKPVQIEQIFSPILSLPMKSQKKINAISKYFKSNKMDGNFKPAPKFYAQASKQNISTSEVIKIKEAFPSISVQKINQINNIVKGNLKPKPHIQMTTKSLSRKQVIISMDNNNISNFMKNSSLYITNINRTLRNAKSEVLVNFICFDSLGITIVTNKVSLQSNLQLIEKYIKSSNDINALQVKVLQLLQSKSYLKIIDILLFSYGNAQEHLTLNNVKTIIKQNHIFDNITLVSKLRVIKMSPKSDIAIIWIDIWDTQSGSKAKTLIN